MNILKTALKAIELLTTDNTSEAAQAAAADARIKLMNEMTVEPVAWMVYVAEVQNQYVVDDIDDAQLVDDCTNHGAEVTPLYLHPPQQADQEPRWMIEGSNRVWRGRYAELDAIAEAKRCGGTCKAYPVYTAPQKAKQVPMSSNEIYQLAQRGAMNDGLSAIVRAVEAHHGIGGEA